MSVCVCVCVFGITPILMRKKTYKKMFFSGLITYQSLWAKAIFVETNGRTI